MFFSHLDKVCFANFLEQLQVHVSQKGLLNGNGATAHTAQVWQTCGLDWQKLPTACLELNPVERFFEELRKSTANQVFNDKQHIEELLVKLVTKYISQPQQVKQLTLFP